MISDFESSARTAARRSLDNGLLMSVLCEVIEYWPVAVHLAGPDGGCVANLDALRLFGLGVDEGAAMPPSQLLRVLALQCSDSKRPLRIEEYPAQRALQGEHVVGDFITLDRRTRNEVTLRCSAQPIRADGHIVGALLAWTDISDLRRSTERIQRSTSDLQQFLAIASHDLQQPIRTMRNYLALLHSHVAPSEDTTALRLLDHAEKAASRMHRLLGNLLDLTRLERQGDRRGRVACGEVVQEVLTQLADVISASQAEVIVDDLPVVVADQAFLLVLLHNLIDNALKYRHPGRRCRITIGVRQLPHETVFSVSDNGQGIESGYLDYIFKPFQRIDAGAGVAGSGLGLDICRRIVSAHAGRIWVESTPGEGSTFSFTLGSAQEHAALVPKDGSPAGRS